MHFIPTVERESDGQRDVLEDGRDEFPAGIARRRPASAWTREATMDCGDGEEKVNREHAGLLL